MSGEPEQKCPSCKKVLTLTEVFFGRCQLCQADLDIESSKDEQENAQE